MLMILCKLKIFLTLVLNKIKKMIKCSNYNNNNNFNTKTKIR